MRVTYQIARGAMVTAALWISGVLVPSAAVTTYYVSTTGNDSYSCAQAQSVSTPKRTIASGFTCLYPGDTLYIRGGTYDGINTETSTPIRSGTSWTTPITVAAYSNEAVHIAPSGINVAVWTNQYLVFDGLFVHNQVRIANGANHIRFINMDISGALHNNSGVLIPQHPGSDFNEFINSKIHDNGDCAVSCTSGTVGHGLYIATSNNLIDGVESYNNGHLGIQLYASNVTFPSNNIIRNSSFHHNQTAYKTSGQGIAVGVGDNNLIYNNIVYNNLGGINVDYNGTNTKVYNNTIYNNRDFGIRLATTTGASIINNIVFQNGTAISNGAANTLLANNLITDPLFVDTAGSNFAIRSGSPAIDSGTTVSAVTFDRQGIPRPQGAGHDIGAYEFASLSLPAPPTNLRIQ